MLITETTLNIGGSELKPGEYGFGFSADGKFVVMDVANNDVLSASAETEAALQHAVPLKLVEDAVGLQTLCGKKVGRDQAGVGESPDFHIAYIFVCTYSERQLSATQKPDGPSPGMAFAGPETALPATNGIATAQSSSAGKLRVLQPRRALLRLFNHLHQDSTTYKVLVG